MALGTFECFVRLMLDFELSFSLCSTALSSGGFSAPRKVEAPALLPSSLISDRDLAGLVGAPSFASLLLRICPILDRNGGLDDDVYHFRFRQRVRHV